MHVVVGATGVAGRSVIAAVRRREPHTPILATSSRAAPAVPGATDVVGGIELSSPGAARRIAERSRHHGSAVDVLFFTPARGAVGFPVAEATAAQVEEALAFSFVPMMHLAELIAPRLTVAFSAFCELPATQAVYGALAHVKRRLDDLASAEPQRFKVVRPGVFESTSAKGVALCTWRELKAGRNPDLLERWRASGARFFDYFYATAWADEARWLRPPAATTPHRPTTPSDLERAVHHLLDGCAAPAACVVGDWLWEDGPPSAPSSKAEASPRGP